MGLFKTFLITLAKRPYKKYPYRRTVLFIIYLVILVMTENKRNVNMNII